MNEGMKGWELELETRGTSAHHCAPLDEWPFRPEASFLLCIVSRELEASAFCPSRRGELGSSFFALRFSFLSCQTGIAFMLGCEEEHSKGPA